MVCEREILASLVEFKHHSMAEMIRNEKEEKKTKAEVPGLMKKDKKHQTSNLNISVTAALACHGISIGSFMFVSDPHTQ